MTTFPMQLLHIEFCWPPMTVVLAERSYSKLKLLKNYLRSTMMQERLTDLATIALEGNMLDKIDY